MKFFVFLSICLAAVSAASFFEADVVEEWAEWKATHGKTYNDAYEDLSRMTIFLENKAAIDEHNSQAAQGKHTYFMEMNQFGDLRNEEFVGLMTGYNRPQGSNDTEGASFLPPLNLGALPKMVDWRPHGYVTPVKYQGRCGSCWAFSATGALEGQTMRKTGKLISLSEQNLVDCTTRYGNTGCRGGWMDNAFKYIKDNQGIDTEKSYPYEGVDNYCRYNSRNKGATDVGFVDIRKNDENHLQQAVATVGPVSVAIDASRNSFQFYSKGVYQDPYCSTWNVTHAVLVVGYGVDKATGQEYWLVKNSWSTRWGDAGYIKMAKHRGNMCGIAAYASYPLV